MPNYLLIFASRLSNLILTDNMKKFLIIAAIFFAVIPLNAQQWMSTRS